MAMSTGLQESLAELLEKYAERIRKGKYGEGDRIDFAKAAEDIIDAMEILGE